MQTLPVKILLGPRGNKPRQAHHVRDLTGRIDSLVRQLVVLCDVGLLINTIRMIFLLNRFVVSIFGAPLLVIIVCYGVICRKIWIYSQSAVPVVPHVPPVATTPSPPAGTAVSILRRWFLLASLRWRKSRAAGSAAGAVARSSSGSHQHNNNSGATPSQSSEGGGRRSNNHHRSGHTQQDLMVVSSTCGGVGG